MSNATDNLIEAEEMIRSAFSKTDDQEIALRICRWLFDFNSMGNGFKIKCYSTKIPDICFCVDRGGDCESEKVRTWFFRIRASKSLFMIFKLIKPNGSYLKLQSGRDTNTNNTFITYAESKKLDLEIIKKHIFESYEKQLNELKLVSNASRMNNALAQNHDQPQDDSDLPTKEDFESAYRTLTRLGESVSVDAVMDQIEIIAKKKGLSQKNNWRMITEENIEIWSRKVV